MHRKDWKSGGDETLNLITSLVGNMLGWKIIGDGEAIKAQITPILIYSMGGQAQKALYYLSKYTE